VAALPLMVALAAVEVGIKDALGRAPADPTVVASVRPLVLLGSAIFGGWMVVLWLSNALFGLALVASGRYPRWLGWVGVALGAWVVMAVGLARAAWGPTSWTDGAAFNIAAILTLVWLLAVAWFEWRNAKA
jgi:hypothetical protein